MEAKNQEVLEALAQLLKPILLKIIHDIEPVVAAHLIPGKKELDETIKAQAIGFLAACLAAGANAGQTTERYLQTALDRITLDLVTPHPGSLSTIDQAMKVCLPTILRIRGMTQTIWHHVSSAIQGTVT